MDRDFFRVVLPWPDWGLSPNKKLHRHEKAKLVRQHRMMAMSISLDSIGFQNWIDADQVFSVWIFRQPSKHRRDTGNIRAAMKSYQDGIFDALKIDDHVIKDEYLHLDGIKKGGEVELRLYEDVRQFLDDVNVLATHRYYDG